MTRMALAMILVTLSAAILGADYLEVRRSVTVKADPAGNADILENLDPGVNLELLSSAQTNGYYQVRVPESGVEGWVYRTFVRRFQGQLPGTITPQPQPSSANDATGTWFRFDQDFVTRHFSNDLAFSSVTFSGEWRASLPHRSSCGGKDGEIHVGAYEPEIEFAQNERPFSRVVGHQTVAWGIVAEPANATSDDSAILEDLEGTRATFTGYMRVWNEGHFDDEKKPKVGGSSNPNHVVELHPAWHMAADDEAAEDYAFQPTAPMTGFAGYGLSKAAPMLTAIASGGWPRAHVTGGQLHVFLSHESNFYQIPVRITSVQASNDGYQMRADVCSNLTCNGQPVLRNLRLIARADSFEGKPVAQGNVAEFVGIFSVHLGRARQLAGAASSEANAVAVTDAIEFFVFSRAGKRAVRNSQCVPETTS